VSSEHDIRCYIHNGTGRELILLVHNHK